MPQMTDPAVALASFQEKFLLGNIKLDAGVLDKDMYSYLDMPNGDYRITYVTLDGKMVTSLVIFGVATTPTIKGHRCFAIGYAVPEKYRNQGRAKKAVESAIREMKHDMPKYGHKAFWVEAIVGMDNKASQRVAEQVISDVPKATTDSLSGVASLRYLRKVEV